MFSSLPLTCLTLGLLSLYSQAAIVLSNLEFLGDRIESSSVEVSPLNWEATPFTTDGFNYRLNSITASIGDSNPTVTPALFMEIWDISASASPGAKLNRLTLDIDTNGVKVWDGNVTLSASTSYFLVVGVDNGGGQWNQFLNLNNPPVAPLGDFRVDQGSWKLETDFFSSTIVQSYSSASLGASWSSDGQTGAPLRMEIDATIIPEPSSCIFLSAAVIGLSFRRQPT